MLFILALVLAFGFALLCGKPLKKAPYLFYALAVGISAVVSAVTFRGLSPAVNTYVIGLFTRGAFATGLWCVVMWTGALPNGSFLMKKLMPVRGELSIFAALLTLGHNIGFGRVYFVRLFTDSGRMTSAQIFASVLTLIMLAVMIPLTVLSFPQVRKKFKASTWKKIQRTAYIFYALIWLHVMTLFSPMARMNRDGYFLSIIVYSIVFAGYAVCRVRKAYITSCRKSKKEFSTVAVNSVCGALFAISCIIPCANARPEKIDRTEPSDFSKDVAVTHSGVKIQNDDKSSTVKIKNDDQPEVTKVSSADNAEVTVSVSVSSETEPLSTGETQETDEQKQEEQDDKPEEQTQLNNTEEQTEPQVQQPEPQTEPDPEPEPEVNYIYNNGTYTSSAYGYDGDVTVTIVIENDSIISISGYTDEMDTSYFESAKDYVFDQILSSGSTNVDSMSGATYSSKAIMKAVSQALGSARR